MTATASKLTAGEPQILMTYECQEGTRQLVAQRVNGKVALSDIPAGDHGKVYLVERHVPCRDELNGIAHDYCQLAKTLDRPPMQSDWMLAS